LEIVLVFVLVVVLEFKWLALDVVKPVLPVDFEVATPESAKQVAGLRIFTNFSFLF